MSGVFFFCFFFLPSPLSFDETETLLRFVSRENMKVSLSILCPVMSFNLSGLSWKEINRPYVRCFFFFLFFFSFLLPLSFDETETSFKICFSRKHESFTFYLQSVVSPFLKYYFQNYLLANFMCHLVSKGLKKKSRISLSLGCYFFSLCIIPSTL